MTTTATVLLEPVGEAQIALESVDVHARLRGLMSEVKVTQTYCNRESSNIEAVYTFPLPLDAVLLGLELDLNGKQMQGIVQRKTLAEESYEEAIEGELAQASFDCPSHPASVDIGAERTEVSLSGGSALMDRDFIVAINEPSDYAIIGRAIPTGHRIHKLRAGL